jgi:hypothetical protein
MALIRQTYPEKPLWPSVSDRIANKNYNGRTNFSEITMEKKIWKSTKSTMKIAWRD